MIQIQEKIREIKLKRSPEYKLIKRINDVLGVLAFSAEGLEEENIKSIFHETGFSDVNTGKIYQSNIPAEVEGLVESDFINNAFYLFEMKEDEEKTMECNIQFC